MNRMRWLFLFLLLAALPISLVQAVDSSASLTDSAKATLVYDQKASNRSRYSGPLIYPAFRWATNNKTGLSSVPVTYLFGDQLIGGTQDPGISGKLFSINRNTGLETWNRDFPMYGSGSIAQNGTFYNCQMSTDVCSAVNLNNGSLKWSYSFGGGHGNNQTLIGNDGTVYTTRQQALECSIGCCKQKSTTIIAFKPDGTIKWQRNITLTTDYMWGGNFSLNNNILYMGYLTGPDCSTYTNNGKLLALSTADGSQLWAYNTGDLPGLAPVIDSAGVIYVGNGNYGWDLTNLKKLYAINSDGTLKWEKSFGVTAEMGFDKMTLRNDGVLIATWASNTWSQRNQPHTVYAIRTSDGTTLWSRRIDNFVADFFSDGNGGYHDVVRDASYKYFVNYYDTNNNFRWKFGYTNSDSSPTYYSFSQLSQDERGWLYIGFSRNNSSDKPNNYVRFVGLAPWTLTASLGSTGTYQPGSTLNFSVTASMAQNNPLQTAANSANKIQVVMDNGDKVLLTYSSTTAEGNTVWTGSYVLPADTANGSHTYTVEAGASDIQTDISTNFATPATGSNNTGITVTGSFVTTPSPNDEKITTISGWNVITLSQIKDNIFTNCTVSSKRNSWWQIFKTKYDTLKPYHAKCF